MAALRFYQEQEWKASLLKQSMANATLPKGEEISFFSEKYTNTTLVDMP